MGPLPDVSPPVADSGIAAGNFQPSSMWGPKSSQQSGSADATPALSGFGQQGSLNSIQEPGLSPYYQTFSDPNRFGLNEQPSVSTSSVAAQPSTLAGFAFGAPGSAAFSHGLSPGMAPFISSSSPLASSPGQGLSGFLASMSPTAISGREFGRAGLASPDICGTTNSQSPFPGVGFGIPGSANNLLPGNLAHTVRNTSGQQGDAESFLPSEESLAVLALARRESCRSQP